MSRGIGVKLEFPGFSGHRDTMTRMPRREAHVHKIEFQSSPHRV